MYRLIIVPLKRWRSSNIWGQICYEKHTEAIEVASKVTGIEVTADTTKYMVLSRNHKTGRSHNVQIDNSSFERVEGFKYLGTSLSNENSVKDEIKGTLKPRNTCYHSVQNLLPSSLL